MRSHKVDLSLRDGSHSDLVKSTSKESSKGTAEHHISITTGQSDSNTTEVLLGNETLDVTIGEGILVGEREGGVLSVTIQSNDTIVRLAKFDKSITVHFTSGVL